MHYDTFKTTETTDSCLKFMYVNPKYVLRAIKCTLLYKMYDLPNRVFSFEILAALCKATCFFSTSSVVLLNGNVRRRCRNHLISQTILFCCTTILPGRSRTQLNLVNIDRDARDISRAAKVTAYPSNDALQGRRDRDYLTCMPRYCSFWLRRI